MNAGRQTRFRVMFGDLGNTDGLGLSGDGWLSFQGDKIRCALDRVTAMMLFETGLAGIAIIVFSVLGGRHWVALWAAWALFVLWRSRERSATVVLSEVAVIRREGRRVSFSPSIGEDGFGSRPAIVNARSEEAADAIEELLREGVDSK